MSKQLYSIIIIIGLLIGLTACKADQTKNNPNDQTSISTIGYTDISPSDAYQLLKNKSNVIFLDVRTPAEVAGGTVEGATVIDYRADGFNDEVAVLDRNASYIVYCRSGGRSSKASKIMEGLGFKNVQNMEGGYTAWSNLEKN